MKETENKKILEYRLREAKNQREHRTNMHGHPTNKQSQPLGHLQGIRRLWSIPVVWKKNHF